MVIQAGQHVAAAANPFRDRLRQALDAISLRLFRESSKSVVMLYPIPAEW